MKRIIMLLLLLVIIAAGAFTVYQKSDLLDSDYIAKLKKETVPKIKSEKEDKKEVLPLLEGDLFDLMGKDTDQLTSEVGDPDRKDKSAYGYNWWVYTDGETEYAQFGVKDDKVETIYATGEDMSTDPLEIGASYEEIDDGFDFEEEVTYHDGFEFYKFLLNEDNLETAPLIKLSDDVFVQCYFDTFTNELSSIRILTGETLLKQRIYEMEYRGKLPEESNFSDEEWKEIEKGMEKQIYDLTNVYRHRFDKAPLKKDKKVQEVAYLHSKDMYDNNYFSHYTQNGDGLKERLGEKSIYYTTAGENIAAQHTDAPAAMEGWLNSEGHREALLNDEYSHIGVGVDHL